MTLWRDRELPRHLRASTLSGKSGVTAGETALFFMIELDSSFHGQLDAELRKGWQRNQIEAAVEARKFAKENAKRHKSVEGLGQLIARIPTTAYHFWGQKLGYACWNDKAFMDEFLRDNPELRVNSGGTKEIHVGWTPPSK